MPELLLEQWDRYEPDVGNNRELPKQSRVFLLVERGLSVRQREAYAKELQAAFTGDAAGLTHRLAAVLSMHLKWGGEALKHAEGEVTTLEQYLELVNSRPGVPWTEELLGLVLRANSFGREDAQLFERPSGTAPGTPEGLPPPTV